MYIPKYAAVQDNQTMVEFIRDHGFGTLITKTAINHFPFIVEELSSGEFVLFGHMARSNPQWKELESNASCACVFLGPHKYISPKWYVSQNQVPTWNYTAVHVKGKATLFHNFEKIEDILVKTVTHFETGPSPWKYSLPEDLRRDLASAIVGFEIKAESIEGKFKLSQNRAEPDYQSVLKHLNSEHDDMSKAMLQYMKK